MKSVSYCARERTVDRNTSSEYQYEYGTRISSCNAFSCTCEPKLKGPTDMHIGCRYKVYSHPYFLVLSAAKQSAFILILPVANP